MAKKSPLKTYLSISSNMFEKLPIARKMEIVRYLEKVGNKRIENLKKSGLAPVSSALHARSGHKFNTRMPVKPENVRKNRKENLEKRLSQGFSEAKSFLGAKSSTIKGASKTLRKASQDFENMDALLTASKAQQKKFWTAYNTLKDYDSSLLKSMDYEKRRQMLFNIMVKRTKNGALHFRNVEESVSLMLNAMKDQYETAQAEKAEENKGDDPLENQPPVWSKD